MQDRLTQLMPARRPRRRALRAVRRVVAASIVAAVVVAAVPPLRDAVLYGATAGVLRAADRWAPDVGPFTGLSGDTTVVAADGRLLATLHQEDRRPLRLSDVPVPVRRAVLAAEDKAFYRHPGVNPLALARAAWRNARGGHQGGSTITQQLAKTNFTTGARTFDRKIGEALIAGVLERRSSKDQLLERYLKATFDPAAFEATTAATCTTCGPAPATARWTWSSPSPCTFPGPGSLSQPLCMMETELITQEALCPNRSSSGERTLPRRMVFPFSRSPVATGNSSPGCGPSSPTGDSSSR